MAGGSHLEIEVGINPGTGPLPLEGLVDQLRTAGVERVHIPEVEVPDTGVREGTLGLGGTLLLTLAGSGDLLRVVIDTIRSWLIGAGARSARLEIDGEVLEVRGLSSRNEDLLVKAFIQRVRRDGQTSPPPARPAGKQS